MNSLPQLGGKGLLCHMPLLQRWNLYWGLLSVFDACGGLNGRLVQFKVPLCRQNASTQLCDPAGLASLLLVPLWLATY